MPLSFQSKNYGDIAFGFFNIESDMLLLENLYGDVVSDLCAGLVGGLDMDGDVAAAAETAEQVALGSEAGHVGQVGEDLLTYDFFQFLDPKLTGPLVADIGEELYAADDIEPHQEITIDYGEEP